MTILASQLRCSSGEVADGWPAPSPFETQCFALLLTVRAALIAHSPHSRGDGAAIEPGTQAELCRHFWTPGLRGFAARPGMWPVARTPCFETQCFALLLSMRSAGLARP